MEGCISLQAGIVHQYVDSPKFFIHCFEHGLYFSLIAYIRLRSDCLTAKGAIFSATASAAPGSTT
jgi:hypothetical protein